MAVCTFWLDPGQTSQAYAMRTHTTKAWTDATISFYAAEANGSGSGGAYQLNHVTLTYRPALSSAKTDCVDPLRPTSGGTTSGTLLTNGDFTSGTASWSLTGQLTSQVAAATLEFYRISGSPAPIIAQSTGTAVAQDQRLAAIVELGNTSPTRQRVTVTLQDANGSDFTNCTFWLAPGAPRRAFAMATYASQAWTNATLAVTPATTGTSPTHAWLQVDTVSLAKTTDLTLGTECFEPGSFTVGGGGVPAPAPLPLETDPTAEADAHDALSVDAAFDNGPADAGPRERLTTAPWAQPVVVTLAGTGSGTVTSNPAGVTCGGQGISCTGWFAEGATVILTAAPDAGLTFAGWSGACTGTGACVVSVVGQQDVVALFSGPLTVTYYHLDALGSVRAVTDTSGATVKRHDYFAFGEDPAPMTGDPIRFTGKELDAETALQYFGARYYRSTLGRFTSPDPYLDTSAAAQAPQRWNQYRYALNNPLRFVDPDGRNPVLLFAVAVAIFVTLEERLNAPTHDANLVDNISFSDVVTDITWAAGFGGVWSGARAVLGRVIGGMFGRAAAAEATAAKAASEGVGQTTKHGGGRVAGAEATRGGVLTAERIGQVRQAGRPMTQADGARVRILESKPGKFDLVVDNKDGKLITTMANVSQKHLENLAKNYGWK